MVASLKRVYENLWRLQKTHLFAAKAHNRALVTLLHKLTHFDHPCAACIQPKIIDKIFENNLISLLIANFNGE